MLGTVIKCMVLVAIASPFRKLISIFHPENLQKFFFSQKNSDAPFFGQDEKK